MPSCVLSIIPCALSPLTSYGGAKSMTGFAEPSTEEKTAALERDFENRAFIADFSQSVQQLATFVSNFGMLHFAVMYSIVFVVVGPSTWSCTAELAVEIS